MIANYELSKVTHWLHANRLSINIAKSNYMIFRPRQKRQTSDIRVSICNQDIFQVKETVFLGVVLDENLTWIPHISNVARKVSKAVGIMSKASFYLPKRALLTLYYSLIYPYLQYCTSVWGSTYPSNLNRLFLLQKRAVRIISNEAFDAHSDTSFEDLKILKFNCIYLLHIGKLMFQFKSGMLPHSFDNKFSLNSQNHTYDTRNSKLFHIPKCRTNLRKFALRYQGPKFYNSLNADTQKASTLSSFLTRLKIFLLDY